MKKLLNQKEQHYADTREEAEEIVTEAKDNDALVMNKISEKYNKYGQYFLVDLTYQYGTPKEVMEGKPEDDTPDGQMSIDEVEQQEEEFNPDSIQFEEETEDETPQPQATESDLPF